MENYVIHTNNGSMVITPPQVFAEVKRQQAAGVPASYRFRGLGDDFPAGWLIWSTWADGAGVAIPCGDSYRVIRGWQGEFVLV